MRIVTKSGFGKLNRTSTTSTGHQTQRDKVTRGEAGFHKPDRPVINPKIDGYRKPSSYSISTFASVPGQTTGGSPRVPFIVSSRVFGDVLLNSGTHLQTNGNYVSLGSVALPTFSRNAIRMKVLNNLRSEVWDVSMTLAELSSTANTLGNNLGRLARSLDSFKKNKKQSFFYLLTGRRQDNRRPTDKFLRETAGSYLEWKYGIMPTVMDIAGACKGLDISYDGSIWDNPPLLVARAKDQISESISCPARVADPGGLTAYSRVNLDVRCELKARLDYRVSGELLRGLNRFGIGLSSLPTVLFERTPFSFVLNMAIPIAELIKAWSALAGVDVVGYCETEYYEGNIAGQSWTGEWSPSSGTKGNLAIVDYSPSEKAVFGFRRDAFSTVPMPMPFIRNPVKVGNMATVLALFTQLRRKDV